MTVWLRDHEGTKTAELLARIIGLAKNNQRVQFLVSANEGPAVVQRFRVALSRSRKRNLERGKKIDEFTLRHHIYPYTEKGKRFDAIVIWIEKSEHHRVSELLDDIMER